MSVNKVLKRKRRGGSGGGGGKDTQMQEDVQAPEVQETIEVVSDAISKANRAIRELSPRSSGCGCGD